MEIVLDKIQLLRWVINTHTHDASGVVLNTSLLLLHLDVSFLLCHGYSGQIHTCVKHVSHRCLSDM